MKNLLAAALAMALFAISCLGAESKMSDMNVVLMGDSITSAAGPTCTGCGWGTFFKRKAQPKSIYNYAVGGAIWHHYSNTVVSAKGVNDRNNVIFNQIYRMWLDIRKGIRPVPGLIIIACGTNDHVFHKCWTDGADAAFSNRYSYVASAASFPNYELGQPMLRQTAWAMRFDVELLMQLYPYAHVIILAPLQRGDLAPYGIETRKNGDEIEKCANYLGVPCIRQDKECCIYSARERTAPTFTVDGLHPNEQGAKLIGYYLASRIEGLLRNGPQEDAKGD